MGKRRGRKRKFDVARQPNGQPARNISSKEIIPMAALARRAEANGVNVGAVVAAGPSAVVQLCQVQTAGTAMGRLMWQHLPDGKRTRRMLPGTDTPIITDAMMQAADAYRAAWAAWHSACGLPHRHPRAMDVGRQPRATSDMSEGAPGWAERRLALADAALGRCKAPLLVRAVLDSVVVENIIPEQMAIGERPAALHALRAGLEAIAQVLVHGRRHRAGVDEQVAPVA
ncbi:hypothetical protein ACM64Y_00570 [Novispirillum sp. DQ9]|uniref:hypothetical protein n=1 Tax=Novispirillum sp. DQ9 TaxID=3398612 RepID=UPI003C7EAD65